MVDEVDADLYRMLHEQQICYIIAGAIVQDQFLDDKFTRLQRYREQYGKHRAPWYWGGTWDPSQSEITRLQEQWEQAFGMKIDDPQVQADIKRMQEQAKRGPYNGAHEVI